MVCVTSMFNWATGIVCATGMCNWATGMGKFYYLKFPAVAQQTTNKRVEAGFFISLLSSPQTGIFVHKFAIFMNLFLLLPNV